MAPELVRVGFNSWLITWQRVLCRDQSFGETLMARSEYFSGRVWIGVRLSRSSHVYRPYFSSSASTERKGIYVFRYIVCVWMCVCMCVCRQERQAIMGRKLGGQKMNMSVPLKNESSTPTCRKGEYAFVLFMCVCVCVHTDTGWTVGYNVRYSFHLVLFWSWDSGTKSMAFGCLQVLSVTRG